MIIKNPAVYSITNIKNGKRYIGSTVNYLLNKRRHLNRLRHNKTSNKSFQDEWNLFEESSFIFEILKNLEQEEIPIMEQIEEEFILKYKTNQEEFGYNKRLPSEQGESDLKKQKISKGRKEAYSLVAPTNLKQMTEEKWLENRKENPNFRITYQLKGNYFTKIYRINENDFSILETFDSVKQAAEKYNILPNKLNESLNLNKSKPYKFSKMKGNIFFREKDYVFPLLSIKEKKVKEFIPYSDRDLGRVITILENIETKKVKEFKSRREAADFLNTTCSKVNELNKGWQNKGKGRICKITNIKGWKFKDSH